MSAVVLLDAIWLNSAADPSDAMAFTYTTDSLKVARSVNETGQEMAGGFVRSVTRPGVSYSANPVFPQCTPEQVAWLNAHQGQIMCFRDHQGTKFFGVYAQVPVSESTMYRDQGDVELTISSRRWSEAV